MDIKKIKRDGSVIQSCLEETKDGRLIATKPLKIISPSSYVDKDLAEIGTSTYILGIFAIVYDDEYYCTNSVCAMVQIDPTTINKVKIENEEFNEYHFSVGQTVIVSLDLVRTDTLVYRIYNEFISKGKIPWYVSYDDLGHLFDTAFKHAGANIGTNAEVTELLVSFIARDVTDKTKYYRTTINNLSDMLKNPPFFIPLKSVTYAATNTTNKLAGSYMGDGLVSALNNPAERSERIEEILRK